MLISSRMFPSKILCLTENRCFIGVFRRKLSLFLFYGRNFVFVEWNGDSFLQDTWEIKTFRFANSKTGFLLSKSFPWHGKQSLQEIWAAATASLVWPAPIHLFQVNTKSHKQWSTTFFHYLNPLPRSITAGRVAGRTFTVCGNNLAKSSAEQVISTLKSLLQCYRSSNCWPSTIFTLPGWSSPLPFSIFIPFIHIDILTIHTIQCKCKQGCSFCSLRWKKNLM